MKTFTQGTGQFISNRGKFVNLHFGDNIKLTPRLVIDVGVRWDPAMPLHSTRNRRELFVADLSPNRIIGWQFDTDDAIRGAS